MNPSIKYLSFSVLNYSNYDPSYQTLIHFDKMELTIHEQQSSILNLNNFFIALLLINTIINIYLLCYPYYNALYYCNKCGVIYRSESQCKVHEETCDLDDESTDDDSDWVCDYCGAVYETYEYCEKHEDTCKSKPEKE